MSRLSAPTFEGRCLFLRLPTTSTFSLFSYTAHHDGRIPASLRAKQLQRKFTKVTLAQVWQDQIGQGAMALVSLTGLSLPNFLSPQCFPTGVA